MNNAILFCFGMAVLQAARAGRLGCDWEPLYRDAMAVLWLARAELATGAYSKGEAWLK